ncbi:hypothetical protein [Candidatus Deianiraea vastatrix]|uniref:Uncharacterized protein n=1 Tax=Candidatus Deianiraea vastatrix TaxID=2163644 RepID=A0A5B8XFT7_9RICK|nr:hypothetical protein [Candidatus Deianiraea vastatrix]QED23796.1 hypothetical protein Deia_01012 [Candidatus Deianiraea vastatrix]
MNSSNSNNNSGSNVIEEDEEISSENSYEDGSDESLSSEIEEVMQQEDSDRSITGNDSVYNDMNLSLKVQRPFIDQKVLKNVNRFEFFNIPQNFFANLLQREGLEQAFIDAVVWLRDNVKNGVQNPWQYNGYYDCLCVENLTLQDIRMLYGKINLIQDKYQKQVLLDAIGKYCFITSIKPNTISVDDYGLLKNLAGSMYDDGVSITNILLLALEKDMTVNKAVYNALSIDVERMNSKQDEIMTMNQKVKKYIPQPTGAKRLDSLKKKYPQQQRLNEEVFPKSLEIPANIPYTSYQLDGQLIKVANHNYKNQYQDSYQNSEQNMNNKTEKQDKNKDRQRSRNNSKIEKQNDNFASQIKYSRNRSSSASSRGSSVGRDRNG